MILMKNSMSFAIYLCVCIFKQANGIFFCVFFIETEKPNIFMIFMLWYFVVWIMYISFYEQGGADESVLDLKAIQKFN